MDYAAGYSTDVGIKKMINQDSLCLKKAMTAKGKVLLAVICDGMGGLSQGELASATVIREFSEWFEHQLPRIINNYSTKKVREDWHSMIVQMNEQLWNYGYQNGIQLGTTLSAILCVEWDDYIIAHVGDTRIYELSNQILQLTEDQTFVTREIKCGRMTKDQAMQDTRRNILLQCIGASKSVEPEFINGKVRPGSAYLLCSDGFRHKLTEEEMREKIMQNILTRREDINALLKRLIQINEERGEKDNISAILIYIL